MLRHNKIMFASGFTLIELSIVLVIIGLIIGGVLTGQALIKNAERNALLSQIEQFKLAKDVFKNKYGQLPGDMLPTEASKYGFSSYSIGDNDGLIDNGTYLEDNCYAEGPIFFVHLSEAALIPFKTSATFGMGGQYTGDNAAIAEFLPPSKGGFGYFCPGILWHADSFDGWNAGTPGLDLNRTAFMLKGPSVAGESTYAKPSMMPIDLYAIDLKIDDGKPLQGKVLNGMATATVAGWGLSATSGVCAYGGSAFNDITQQYNANPSTGGNTISCLPMFVW